MNALKPNKVQSPPMKPIHKATLLIFILTIGLVTIAAQSDPPPSTDTSWEYHSDYGSVGSVLPGMTKRLNSGYQIEKLLATHREGQDPHVIVILKREKK
jgi:hypothetical protein